jgi:Uma2 family endonuclease
VPRPLYNVTNPLTCDDLWRIQEASDERLEIIDGELFATPPSTPMHQTISGSLFVQFVQAVDDLRLGATFFAMLDVRLAKDTVVQPDLMILRRNRSKLIAEWESTVRPACWRKSSPTFPESATARGSGISTRGMASPNTG